VIVVFVRDFNQSTIKGYFCAFLMSSILSTSLSTDSTRLLSLILSPHLKRLSDFFSGSSFAGDFFDKSLVFAKTLGF